MSSPSLNHNVFSVDAIPETRPEQFGEPGADAALTARAMVAVTLLGAGFWYLLWKVALHFFAGL